MAKTPLFSRLKRLQRQIGITRVLPRATEGLTKARDRRDFLKTSTVALTGLALPALPGCSDAGGKPETRITIIGGGMAGLHCAYRLQQAGITAQIYEASPRTGGRMYTARGMFPDDQIVELGGELIDSVHLTLQKLASELGVTLDDREAVTARVKEVWWVDGKAVPEETIVEQFTQVAPLMASLAEMADADEAAYESLDVIPLSTWLDENLVDQPELHSVLSTAYCCEYGLETSEQSVLNLLYLIGSDDPSPFRIFGESDERYHAHEGSEAFVDKLADKLKDQISLNRRLTTVKNIDDIYELTFVDDAGEKIVIEADHVVFALPFTMLRKVDLDESSLSPQKRQIIEELGYGTNAKVMGAFTERVWLKDHDATGSVTADLPFQQCWDTSSGQNGDTGILTNYLGGKQGEESGKGSAEDWYTSVMLPGAEQVFPGSLEAYVPESAVRMHWPSYAFNLGSYACYRPGQWAFYGQEGEREGNLHFCGEHCSLDFQGYMEGAAETGALVAAALLNELDIALPDALADLMNMKLVVEQPAFGALRARPRFWSRRFEIMHTLRAASIG